MSHPYATAYATAMGSLLGGDVDGYISLLAEDIHWWELGSKQPVVGKRAVLELLLQPSDIELITDLHDVLANTEHLVGLIHATARMGSIELGFSYAEVLHFNQSGEVNKRQAFPSDIWTALELLEANAQIAG